MIKLALICEVSSLYGHLHRAILATMEHVHPMTVPLSVAKLLSGIVGYPMMSSEYYKHRDLLPRGWMKWVVVVAKKRH
jgi:hypothetical protein